MATAPAARVSLTRIFNRDLIGTTIHCSLLAACFMVSYYSVTYWYARFLQLRGSEHAAVHHRAERRRHYRIGVLGRGLARAAGRRGAVTCAAALGVVVSPLYLMSADTGVC